MTSHSPSRFSLVAVFAGLALVLISATALAADDVTLNVQSSSPESTTLAYTIADFDSQTITVEGKDYLALSLDHAGYLMMDQAGHPQLPALHDSIMIPDDARMGLRVLKADYYEVGDVDLISWRGPISRAIDPSTVPYPFGPVYSANRMFPAEVAALRDPYVLHDTRGVVVRVSPFQYNPVSRVLRVYTAITVEVSSIGDGVVNTIDRSSYGHRPDRSWSVLYEDRYANYGAYAVEPPLDHGDMLIISHGPFIPAMQPLIDWKNANGINTTIVDVATIGNDATSILNYIQGVYAANNLAFVLLVGDYPEIRSPWYAGGLSDPSYSLMTADWYPDLFVGRFSAQTVAHVDTQVQRTIEYENQEHSIPAGGWNTWGVGVASSEGAGIGHYGEGDWQHADLMRNELLDMGFTKVDKIYEPSANKGMITNALNEGRRILNYTGHGSSTSWGTTGFNNNDVNALTNVGMLPVICSVACVNGQFDIGTCFAEAWLRATHNGEPAGAVATYMSTINQSWAPPMYGQGNHGYNEQYAANERFCLQSCASVCGMWFGGSCVMMDIAGNSGREMFMTWTTFGDPSLQLHSDIGDVTLGADGWAIPMNDPVDITLTVDVGTDYAGAQYFLLPSLSGTTPGFDLPNGLHVPLNVDLLTELVISAPNGWVFDGFYGTLDGAGLADAHFDTTGATPIDPALVGLPMSIVGIVWHSGGPFELVTNVKVLTFVR
jgi:gingipain R